MRTYRYCIALITLLLLALPAHPTLAAACTPQVIVNGTPVVFDVPPVIESGRTLVPLRAIFEALGAEVFWNGDTQTASAVRGDVAIAIQIGNPVANRNDSPVLLDVPAKLIGGRTMVPLRFVSEALGSTVTWDGPACTVTITDERSTIASDLVGGWAQGLSSWDVVDATTGASLRAGWSGEWYFFKADGTFRYAIGGNGTIIAGVVVQDGTWTADAEHIYLTNITETWAPLPNDPSRKPAYKDKAHADVTLTYSFTEEGALRITEDGFSTTYRPIE